MIKFNETVVEFIGVLDCGEKIKVGLRECKTAEEAVAFSAYFWDLVMAARGGPFWFDQILIRLDRFATFEITPRPPTAPAPEWEVDGVEVDAPSIAGAGVCADP